MNMDIYLNDGKEISSIGISGATLEEASSAIKAFGFGENEEEWLYSDNQKIKYRVEDLDTRRSIGRQLLELEEERDKWKNDYNEAVLYYIGLINKHIEECDEWKEKYKIECQHNDIFYRETRYTSLLEELDAVKDERDEWKQKYSIECMHNDSIKKSYDELVKDFNDLVKERDDAKYLYENTTKAYDELHEKLEELERNVKYWKARYEDEVNGRKEDVKFWKARHGDMDDERIELKKQLEETIRELNEYKEIASDRDDLKVENDKLKMELVGAKTTCVTLEQDKFFWKNRWESEFKDCVRVKKENEKLKKELEECQPKSES